MKKKLSLLTGVIVLAVCSFFAMTAYAQELDISSSDFSAVLNTTSYTYDTKAKEPSVTVKYTDENGKTLTLKKDTDYTVTYKNNVNAGTATAQINGIGDYAGTVTKNFKINPLNISKNNAISLQLGYYQTIYSGYRKTPTPYLYLSVDGEKKLLKRDTDYTIEFKNNVNMGKATIYIYGCKNLTGTISKDFKILPPQMKNLKSSVTNTATAHSITLTWNKVSGASGYQIYTYDYNTQTYKYLIRIAPNQSSYTVKNLGAATNYYYKIRAYKTIAKDTYYYGEFSDFTNICTSPNRVTLNYASKTGPNTISVSWKTLKCTGYQIYYSSDPTFKTDNHCIRVNGSSTSSYTIKGVSRYRTYYVRVRAFTMCKGIQYSGYMSYYLGTGYNHLYMSYTSNYVNNYNRTQNLIIASNAINGTIIQPGQTFSFNDVVGPRTTAKGYKNAPVFSETGVENGIGGGICQVASTMFNCALYSNVEIVERHQHNQRVSYVPLGRDAAISGTYQDLKWKNTTGYPIKIEMTVSGGKISCRFYTTANVNPPSVSLKVSQSGKNFTMRRYVGGRVNYSCYSKY